MTLGHRGTRRTKLPAISEVSANVLESPEGVGGATADCVMGMGHLELDLNNSQGHR